MAADNVRSGAGFRHCVIFELDSANDIIMSTTGSGAGTAGLYQGVHVSGVKALTISDPPPRQIAHIGDDSVFATMSLPPTTAPTGTLTTGKIDDEVEAILTANKKITLAGASGFGVGTSTKGDENYVCILAYRQAVSTKDISTGYGNTVWESRLIPLTKLVAVDAGFSDTPETKTYSMIIQIAKKYPWGPAFSVVNDGFTSAAALRYVTNNKPKIVTFHSDGVSGTFLFDTSYPALSTATMRVWLDGVEVLGGMSKSTLGITFWVAPLSTQKIHVFYEVQYD